MGLPKRDLGSSIQLCSFLSQVFDYGNINVEKRANFLKSLLLPLTVGREREGVTRASTCQRCA